MTNSTYRLVPAPKYAAMMDWECTRCGRCEVKPVFLSQDGGQAAAYGTGCAARLMGYAPAKARSIRMEADNLARIEAGQEELRQERKGRYTIALAAFQAREDGSPELASTRKTYHALGGSEALGSFSGWMATVATTGNI